MARRPHPLEPFRAWMRAHGLWPARTEREFVTRVYDIIETLEVIQPDTLRFYLDRCSNDPEADACAWELFMEFAADNDLTLPAPLPDEGAETDDDDLPEQVFDAVEVLLRFVPLPTLLRVRWTDVTCEEAWGTFCIYDKGSKERWEVPAAPMCWLRSVQTEDLLIPPAMLRALPQARR
jgi:hypothetical protein